MGSESFYGGRMGASFIIVKHFDGVDIPNNTAYKVKNLAVTTDKQYFIYNNGFIEKTANNYSSYIWKAQALDGSQVDTKPDAEGTGPTSRQVLSTVYAEGMRQCFEQGGDTTDIVNYGEYVIIDTIDKSNPDNGKVYRRGMNFDYNPSTNPLAGAEYIGQIVGPQGQTPEIDIDHYQTIIDEYGSAAVQKIYDEINQDIVPGSYVDGSDIRHYEDDIKYTYVTMRDAYNNIQGCLIGFRFPTLVQNFEARSMKPYDNRSEDPETGEYYNYGLIVEDPEQYNNVTKKWQHPFYQKWQIKIPHGYHGIDSTNIELVHTKTMPAGYKEGFAGTALYTDVDCDIPYTDVSGHAVILTTSIDVLRESENITYRGNTYVPIYDLSTDSCKVNYNGNTLYVKKEDCYMDIIRYRETDYDEYEDGEIRFYDIGDYNIIQRITLSENGVLTAFYSHQENPYVFDQVLRWIVSDGISLDDHGTVKIIYNTLNGSGEHEEEEFYQKLRWIDKKNADGITIDDHGTVTIYYNTLDGDGNHEKEEFYQILRSIDTQDSPGVTIDDNGTITIYYNTLDGSGMHEKQIFSQVLRWIDNVNASGITIANDGTVRIEYNTFHDDGSGTMVRDYQEYPKALDWITNVTLSQDGKFTVLFNNDTIQDGKYETTLKWIDYIDVTEDGIISFYYNTDHMVPAYQAFDRIKYLSELTVQTKDSPTSYEGTGDQKIHVQYNTGESETIGEPLNYIIETKISVPNELFPDVPYCHLLVYYADPALRLALKDVYGWVAYPSDKVIDGTDPSTGDPIYHVWTEWIDLGPCRGVPGGIHILKDVTSLTDLEDSSGNPIPPEELPDRTGTIINPDAMGWAVTYTPTVGLPSEVMFYDYEVKQWYSIGSIDSAAIDPRYVIDKSPHDANDQPQAGTATLVKTNGFWFATEQMKYAL